MIKRVTATELVRNFTDLISRVSYLGEALIVVRGGREIAEVRPLVSGRKLGDLPGLLASLPSLGPEDAQAFAADVEASRSEMKFDPKQDPWAS